MNIRKELSKRLDAEAKRKGINPSKIARLANLFFETVNDVKTRKIINPSVESD